MNSVSEFCSFSFLFLCSFPEFTFHLARTVLVLRDLAFSVLFAHGSPKEVSFNYLIHVYAADIFHTSYKMCTI